MKGKQRGVSLIDALIAVLIFSVGLLAVAALQSITKRSNYEAIQRSHAATLAYDLFERMRMNSSATALAAYLNESPIEHDPTKLPSAVDLTTSDVREWGLMLIGASEIDSDDNNVGGLFTPTACLSGPAGGAPGQYTLAIVWRGQTSLENTNPNTCGQDSGLYGANNEYRRILVLETYLSN